MFDLPPPPPIEIHFPISHQIHQNWTDYNVTYDALVEIIQRLQNLDERTNENDLRTIRVALAHISRLGAMHASEAEKDFLTRDIVQLFSSDEEESFLDLVEEFEDSYGALAFGYHQFVPCKSLKKHCKKLLHNISKFTRKHKKEIIIGAVAAVAIGVGAYFVAGALAETAVTATAGAAAASAGSDHHKHSASNEPPPLEPIPPEPFIESYENPEVCVAEPFEKTNEFKGFAKDLATEIVHEVLKGVGDTGELLIQAIKYTPAIVLLNGCQIENAPLDKTTACWQECVVTAHEKVDEWFDTSLASKYTDPLPPTSLDFLKPIKGELPPPFFGAFKEAGEVAKAAQTLARAEEAAAIITEVRSATAIEHAAAAEARAAVSVERSIAVKALPEGTIRVKPDGVWEVEGINIKKVDLQKEFQNNKMIHIFEKKEHGLSRLKLSPNEIQKKISEELIKADLEGYIPSNQPFCVQVNVDGQVVEVRGIIKDGNLRYGTFYIPEEQ
jgi:hypothetical protein